MFILIMMIIPNVRDMLRYIVQIEIPSEELFKLQKNRKVNTNQMKPWENVGWTNKLTNRSIWQSRSKLEMPLWETDLSK